MTTNDVKSLITLINAYYPTVKLINNEMDVIVWCKEFADLDKDITIAATREVCNETTNPYEVNIAKIKNKIKEIEKQKRTDWDAKLIQKIEQQTGEKNGYLESRN